MMQRENQRRHALTSCSLRGRALATLLVAAALGIVSASAQERPQETSIWAMGHTWQLTSIEWREFLGQYELRVVAGSPVWDRRSAFPEQDVYPAILAGLCTALLGHRPYAPSGDLGRDDIFRVSVSLLSEDEDNDLEASRLFSVSVVDGACPEVVPVSSLPLRYGPPLDGWHFDGFAIVEELASIERWGVNAVPVFTPPDRDGTDVPWDLLCRAAAYEARTWRILGGFRQGARLAIALDRGEGSLSMVFAIYHSDGCSYPPIEDSDDV
jgi:hypothetical protein